VSLQNRTRKSNKNLIKKTVVESKGSSYIQFAALSSEENANQLKQKLASIGVSATIKQIHTQKGTLYRLRAGPFSKETAENKLHQVKSNGLSGIITGS
jgi:cell division septation protein DedD